MRKIIDSHVHIKDEYGLKLSDLTDAMRAIQTEGGLSAFNLASIPCWDEDHTLQNLLALYCKALYPDDVYFFGGLEYYQYPQRPGIAYDEQLHALLAMGADGVKLIDTKPMVRKRLGGPAYTHPVYQAFFKLMEQKKLPVLWHVGDPEEFWHRDKVSDYVIASGWFYGDGTYPQKEELYREALAILDKYPQLQVVFAHMFFLSADIERADRILEKYPNVRFDLTPGIEMYDNFYREPALWRSFFVKYQDRIIFGTDSGWSTDEGMRVKIDSSVGTTINVRRFLETDDTFVFHGHPIQGVHLPPEVADKILYKNFLTFVGGKPKPVDYAAARTHCAQILAELSALPRDFPHKDEQLARAQEFAAFFNR